MINNGGQHLSKRYAFFAEEFLFFIVSFRRSLAWNFFKIKFQMELDWISNHRQFTFIVPEYLIKTETVYENVSFHLGLFKVNFNFNLDFFKKWNVPDIDFFGYFSICQCRIPKTQLGVSGPLWFTVIQKSDFLVDLLAELLKTVVMLVLHANQLIAIGRSVRVVANELQIFSFRVNLIFLQRAVFRTGLLNFFAVYLFVAVNIDKNL